ncbi:MAG: MBL fold metallo-hydrolase [Lachnospiraceae bacterium]|nr:MBL fold metallo-hydrolase [Lachnospiraceae bacterium]
MKECNIEKVLNGRLAEFCYFIHANDNDCICIDPGYETDRIMRYIEQHNLVVKEILLTHGHFDHMLSCYYLQQKFGSNIYISKEDEEILYNAEHNYSNLINKTTFDEFKIKDYVKDNEMINLLGYDIRCISTPGHTKGSMSFYFETQRVLFSGDTLFFETYGRVDLYGGSYADIKNSIENKLFTLPNEVLVYPGHGETTSIGKEKLHNDIRRMSNEL